MCWSAAVSKRWWRVRCSTTSSRSGQSSGRTRSTGSASGRRGGSGRCRAAEIDMGAGHGSLSGFGLAFRLAGIRRAGPARPLPGGAARGPRPHAQAARGDDDLNPGAPMAMPDAAAAAAVLVPIVGASPTASMLLTQRHAGIVEPCRAGRIPRRQIRPRRQRCNRLRAARGVRGNRARAALRAADRLSRPYHTRTGFRVMPVVALVDTGFALAPAPDEVDARLRGAARLPDGSPCTTRRATRELAGQGAPVIMLCREASATSGAPPPA